MNVFQYDQQTFYFRIQLVTLLSMLATGSLHLKKYTVSAFTVSQIKSERGSHLIGAWLQEQVLYMHLTNESSYYKLHISSNMTHHVSPVCLWRLCLFFTLSHTVIIFLIICLMTFNFYSCAFYAYFCVIQMFVLLLLRLPLNFFSIASQFVFIGFAPSSAVIICANEMKLHHLQQTNKQTNKGRLQHYQQHFPFPGSDATDALTDITSDIFLSHKPPWVITLDIFLCYALLLPDLTQ